MHFSACAELVQSAIYRISTLLASESESVESIAY